MKNSQIVVVTPGRFHSFDLAEQLHAAGRLAAIYTGYPKFKLRNTEVNTGLIRSFPWLHTPELALGRVPQFPRRIIAEVGWHAGEALAGYAASTLPECGLVTALSGSGLRVGELIQQRGGIYVCDRGSSHILWAKRALEDEYRSLGFQHEWVDQRLIDKEQAEYALADAITLPSRFTLRTFVEMGIPPDKLRLVPYGVNLSVFQQSVERAPHFRVLFVGALSVRKGLHYLLDAFRRARLPGSELVLVGGATDVTAPLLRRYPIENLVMTGHVARDAVVHEMSRASVMVLPSIEEGLARVLAQALACGCPVIASANTGAGDLFHDGREGFIIPSHDVEALVDRLTRLYRDRELLRAMAAAGLTRVRDLGGWDEYGRNSLRVFDKLLSERTTHR